MGLRRALMLAGTAVCGLWALAAPVEAGRRPADDYVPYVPSGFFVFDWSGYYAGAHVGAATTLAESALVLFPNNPILFESFTFGESQTTATGGLQVGWQRQWGKIVAGIELGFNVLRFRSTSDAQTLPGFETAPLASVTRTSEVGDLLLLTGRVGYADGRWLAYFKGGLANADVDVTYRDLVTGFRSSSNGRETGWTAGLGIDYALTLNLFLGIEYNYTHFTARPEPPPFPQADFGNVDIDSQNLLLRLNYRFNPPCCVEPAGPP